MGLLAIVAPALSGCYAAGAAIVFGILSASDNSVGDQNCPTQIEDFQVTSRKEEPAKISFRLRDSESNPATVKFSFRKDGGVDQLLEAEGILPSYLTSPRGISYEFDWMFSSAPGLETDGSL
jgi:hypothetical protein